jgi:hypothetical protein
MGRERVTAQSPVEPENNRKSQENIAFLGRDLEPEGWRTYNFSQQGTKTTQKEIEKGRVCHVKIMRALPSMGSKSLSLSLSSQSQFTGATDTEPRSCVSCCTCRTCRAQRRPFVAW